jgi:hypothetical protein
MGFDDEEYSGKEEEFRAYCFSAITRPSGFKNTR